MIGYITLGASDLKRAATFYDALLAEVGAKRYMEYMESEKFVAWAVRPDLPALSVIVPFDGRAATPGNGTMVALAADSTDVVDRVHRRAMWLGGKDEGAPGPRGQGFYAGYFRDLDGNKLNVFFMG